MKNDHGRIDGASEKSEKSSDKNFQKGTFSKDSEAARKAFLEFRRVEKGDIGRPITPLHKKMQSGGG
jgi:hypothetical protein